MSHSGIFPWLRQAFYSALVAPTRRVIIQAPRALAVSVLAAAVDIGVLSALVESAVMRPWLAAPVGYLTGGLVQFAASEWWVFSGHENRRWGLVRRFLWFQVLSLGGLACTWLIMLLVYGWLGFHYLVAKTLGIAVTFFFNYLSRRWWVYREHA